MKRDIGIGQDGYLQEKRFDNFGIKYQLSTSKHKHQGSKTKTIIDNLECGYLQNNYQITVGLMLTFINYN